jgi:hypothetical protein
VNITDDDVAGELTRIRIVAPKDGAQFMKEAIRIEALAVDREGFIARLRFVADGTKVGESAVAWPECVGCEPKPGDPARHVFDGRRCRGSVRAGGQATHRVVFDLRTKNSRWTARRLGACPLAVGTPPMAPVISIKAAPSPRVLVLQTDAAHG